MTKLIVGGTYKDSVGDVYICRSIEDGMAFGDTIEMFHNERDFTIYKDIILREGLTPISEEEYINEINAAIGMVAEMLPLPPEVKPWSDSPEQDKFIDMESKEEK